MSRVRASVAAQLGRGAGSSLAIQVTAVGVALGVQLLLTRVLGVESYGVYAYATSWLIVLAILARLGLDNATIRFVAVYFADADWSRLRGLLRRSPARVMLAGGLLGAALGIAGWSLAGGAESDLAAALVAAGFAVPVAAVLGLRQSALRGLGHVGRSQAPEMLIAPSLLAILTLASSYWTASLSGTAGMVLHALALAGALVVAELWLRQALPAAVGRTPPVAWRPEWLTAALPMLLINGLAMVLAKTDVLMLGAWEGTTVAGNYSVAARLARPVLFGLMAATSIAAPMIAESYARRDRTRLQEIARQSALGILALTLPAAAALAFLGNYLLSFFDPSFVAGNAALRFLILGYSVSALSGSVSYYLTMTGHQVRAARLTAVAAALNIALNALWIPRFGMNGAAAATAVSLVALNLLLARAVRQSLGIDPTVGAIFRSVSKLGSEDGRDPK